MGLSLRRTGLQAPGWGWQLSRSISGRLSRGISGSFHVEYAIGVYQSRCDCCKYFQAAIAGVPPRGRYASEVRNTVANALIRDRMPYLSVMRRMQEDYRLTVCVHGGRSSCETPESSFTSESVLPIRPTA
jgi:hypothetical protein